jgi:hypothetical protein
MGEETTTETTETTETTAPVVTEGGMSANQVRELVGEVFDTKLSTLGLDKLEKIDALDNLSDTIEGIVARVFEANKPAESPNLLGDIDKMISDRLSRLGTSAVKTEEKARGWLGRLLSA